MPDPWDSKTVIGLFCDPYVASTNLEGGHSEDTLQDVSGWLSELKKYDNISSKAKTVIDEATELFAEGARLGRAGFGPQWCQDLKHRLEKLKPGQLFLAPGGWRNPKGGHAIIYLFQCMSDSEFRFAVCNTGEGVNAHPEDAGADVFPKEKRLTSWLLKGIPREQILDELWLYSLFKIYYRQGDHHKPNMLYEFLLPMLCPSGDVRKETDTSWSTSATCQRAGSCYYKCCPAALRLILGIRGVEEQQRKLVFYYMRLGQLSRIHQALNDTELEAMTESDFMVVECACRQMGQKVLYQKTISSAEKESARGLISDVDGKVAEAREIQRKALASKAVGISEGVPEDFVGYCGFPGWELLSVPWFGHGNKLAYEHLMGHKDSLSPGQHVDIAALRELNGYNLLFETYKVCDKLENNGFEEISKLRIGSIIEDVMLRQFPPGHADWNEDFDMHTQGLVLKALWRLTQHYVTAVASSTTSRTQVAAQILTMRSLHAAFETVLRRAATDGMLPTTQAIICPHGGDDTDSYRSPWSFTGEADFEGKSAAGATEGLPLSTPKLAEVRDRLARHPAGEASKGDSAWDRSLNGLKYRAEALKPTQELVKDLTRKVLRIMSNVLPPNHSDEWPKWTVPFGWALNSTGEIKTKAPEFYMWRDICVWARYLCLDPQCRKFKGVFKADAATITWRVGYCKPCEILKAQASGLLGNVKFDQLEKGFTTTSGASLSSAGLKNALSEDDVIHAPTLPTFGQALAQEEAEHVLSALTMPYLRIPLLLHFLAADRLHALKQTTMQEMLWAALLEPAVWGDDESPKPVENAPELRGKLGTSFGLLHNEVIHGLSSIAAPFCALCAQAEELAGLAPPEEFDGPPAVILQFFVRLCSRVLDQLHNQNVENAPDLMRTLKVFLEEKAVKHLKRWIDAASQEMDTRCRLHAHLALTCLQRDVSDPENLILLLSSSAYVMAWYERDFSDTFGTELQMVFEVVQRRRVEVINAVKDSPKRKYVLDEAAKITSNFFTSHSDEWNPGDGPGSWKCDKKGGAAVFNLQTCTLWLESGLLRPIPPKLQRTPHFVEFFRMHPVKLQPTCRPVRLSRNCHILSAVDDDSITFEMQWWSSQSQQSDQVSPEDDEGFKWRANGSCKAVACAWKSGEWTWNLPGGMSFELSDVPHWLKSNGKTELAEVWERLLTWAQDPGNDDEGEDLAPLMGTWFCQTSHFEAKELVAVQYLDRQGVLEARFACEGHPVIRIFTHHDFGRHSFRSQVFCSDVAFSYASLVPNDGDREERPLCNPQFAGKIGFLPKDETLAIFDDGKRLWVPPVALQGLLPAALLEGCRFWAKEEHGVVSFKGEPYNPPVYNSLNYTMQVTCENGIAKVTRKVGDKIWVLASPIHAPRGSQIERFAEILGPLEAMSHALFWTNEDGTEVCLVELPRVQLRFVPGPDPNGRGLRLFSKEFGGFYLLNRRGVYDPEAWKEATGDPRAMDLAKFLAKMPHAVILRSASGAIRILVTSADVKRPNIKCKPFSTDLVVNRKILVALSGKTFLWDFHESGSLLLTSSLSGTLYLSLLTLLHRDYTSSARLIGSVGFDEGISAEEFRLLKMMLTLTVKDRHPDASALRLKLILALIAHNPKHPLLEPDNKLIGSDYYDYLIKLTHISQSCQLQLREEGVLLRNMQEMECEMWPQAVNRFKFVEAALNESPACVLRSSVDHPAANREGMLGYEILSRRMDAFCNNLWYENFSVDMKDAGKNRSDLESLTEFLDRCDREDWTCSGTLFFSLYAHLTGISTATLNGKDVTKRLVRLAIERYWLRCVRLSKNPSGDDIRAICTLWSVLGMNAMGMSHNLPPWEDAAKLHKESKYGCMIGHDETCGRTFLNALHEALKSGYSCAESLVPKVIAQPSSQQEKLTISEEAMPKFAPPCAPRLTDFAKGSCGLEGEEDEVLSMLSIPLKSISERFMSTFEETLNVPENPFSQERLAGLPGGMTRMGAAIIKGKLDGHAVFLERARKKKGFSLSCLSKPDDSILGDCLATLDELETEIKGCWSHDLEKVISLRTELLKKADLAPKDGGGEGTRFWLARRGGIEGHVWLEWCIGSELDNVREFTGCVEAVNKVVDKGAARDVGRGILGLMLHVNRVAQAQLVLGCVQDLRGAVKRAQRKGIDEVVWKELQTLAGRVAMFLGCRRNYTTSSPEISPAFLLFEYVTGFMVRKQQVDLIRRFAEEAFAGRSLVAQMIMGAGKTTCIAPMLTLLLGNDGRLVLNIVPRALLAQTRNVMRTMFGQILAKRVVTLEFSRMMGQDDPFDVKLVKMQLFDAQRDAAVVCTTPAAIKSMFLRHLELLQMNHILSGTMENFKKQLTKATDSVSQTRVKRRLDDVNKEMTGNRVMAGFIGEVLGMLRNNSCALIDEVDLVLHPLKSELNFPIGSFEMYDLGCERWHLAVHLLDALFLNDEGHAAAGIYYPEIRNCSGKGQAAAQRISELEQEIPEIVKKGYDLLTLQKQPHLVLLSRAFYDKNLLRPLADWLACWIVTRTEAKKFREGVELKDVCEFLSMDLADLLKSDVKTKVQSQADGTIGKLLCLGREWLFQLIPHVLSKVNRVQYGLLTERELSLVENQKAPSSRRLLAVPFIAKDKPSPAAEFAQPDVLIGFTVLAYRYEGMRLSDTVSMLHHLQMKSGRESGPWGSRPTCVLFERWKDIGAKRYKEKGGKSSVGGLGPLNWEVNLNDGWKKLPNNITELLREAVAKKETKVKFTGFGAQPYEIDLEKMVQTNLKSKKARDIRQMEESDKRGEDLKLPELQALSSSTGDEEDKKKKQKAKEEKDSGGAEAETDPLLKGRDAVQEKPEGHAQVAVELLGPVPEIVLWYLLTMVFDAVLRQQPHKLSATGQELGSSMLFSSRIGFSGTPSSLLPEDLGECLFEAENEGEILSVLSDEQHVVPPLINLASDWSPESILNMVAKSSDPVYHCLIDTGALVMGFTNEEVAKLLLKLLPEELFDGVAYFDDRDAPMVILRGAVKPALLSEAGVPMDRRFTFFDQVHTTGTDTKQPLQSYAALTLSASMTFRDYAQGAWRMRGLGKGQKLRMVIAPELAKKVQGIVKVEGELGLHDAVAFMLSNQFDSEGKQFAALQLQNLATVWRQHALNDLMEKEVKVRESKDMRPQVESFLESLRFPVESKVHQPLTLDQKMQGLTDEQAHIMNDDEKAHCAKLIGDASGGGDGGDLGAEITRQQEKEQEKQQEKEKEVEVHVGREREREVEWPLEILEKETKPEESGVFFQLAKFQMAGLKTKLKCTGNALVSSNHTANALTTMNVRRMKSVIIMLVVGPKTMAVSMAEAAALRRAKHLESEHLPSNSNLWICSGCKKVPESSLNLFAKDNVVVEPDSGEKMADPSTRARRLEAARCLLRFFNCDLDFRPDEVTSAVKALESGCQPKQRQHFVETVLGARRREACSWRDTPLGEIVRGDSAKLEERARLVQNLYGLMKDRFRSAGDFFKVLDVNGDGVLQHEEFQRSMKKVFKGTFSPEDVRKLFNAADTSGRGNVTLQDLRQLLQSGAAATGGVIADESPEADDPGSPTSPTADEPEDPDPGIHPASTGGDPNPDVSPSGPSADTTSVLWTVPPEAIQREIEEVLRRVNAGGSLRQRIINSMSGMLGKGQAGFLSTLRMLAGLDQEDMPETKSLIREVEDAGRDLESEHDIYAFQLMVLANLLDDKVLQSELEDLYVAAEGEDGNGLPMPPCLVTVDKYLAKALDMWNTYPEKWSTMSQIECSEEKLKEVIANARSLSSSSNAQMLALAKCHTAELSIVAKTDAAELCLEQLTGVVQKYLKGAKDGKEEEIHQVYHTMLEWGVFLVANLVQKERAATIPKLKGPLFQEAAGFVWDKKQDDVKILAALSYVLQALSMNITKWQVEMHEGEWSDMAAEQQLALRTAASKGETVLHFRARGFPYEIDIKAMTQTNLKSGTSRKIKEVDVTSFAAGGEEAEEEKPYKWQVSNGKGGWWDFPPDVDTKVKEAKGAGLTIVTCSIRGQPYEVDLNKMHQKNTKTGTKREIRMCPI